MKKYTVHWTYEVVSLPVDLDWEYEVFLTFHPTAVPGSYPLTLSAEDVREWFFPELFDYVEEFAIYDTEQEPYDVISELDYIQKVEEVVCKMLNDGNSDYTELTGELEDQAFEEWESVHRD